MRSHGIYEFFAETDGDPRRNFVENCSCTKRPGQILVYNQQFEITRLKELAELFQGNNSADIGKLISRVKDTDAAIQEQTLLLTVNEAEAIR
jgi:hypothetical protein